ncbi:MAG: type II toxin-antitoxin system HicB family antitoxin [Ruminococcus sp.]|nr:type II toxin-antitoxin system HicB family antitoxin [Ruminococcus sp.]
MKMTYPAIFHKEDNSFWVEFPDLEGCHTFGDTLEETVFNAREALEGYAISFIENKQTLPGPSNIENPDISDGFVSLVDVDLTPYFNRKKAVKKTLSIPDWLNDAVIERGINFSQVLQDALLSKIMT